MACRGETIANLITELLKSSGIDISYCGSQTYDGGGNMAGKQNGASLNFKKKYTQNDRALYYHCASQAFEDLDALYLHIILCLEIIP